VTVRIVLVGGVAVENDALRVDGGVLASRRSRLILAALALHPEGLGSRSLAEHIWPDPPATAASALRGAVAALRAALAPIGLGGQELIQSTATGWAFRAGATVDLEEASVDLGRAQRELDDGRAEACLASLESVLRVARGALLGEDREEWIDELRGRQTRLAARTVALLAEASAATGRSAAAIEAAEELLGRDPIDERAHRILIRALAASGDRAGAIRAFEHARSVLSEELGVDPGPEVTAAYLEVLRSGSSGMGALPEPPRNGFFGRQSEVTRLVDGLRSPGVVTVVGRGGVGKSRLALHAAHAATGMLGGGRHWVSLGDLAEPGLVPVAIASAVGVPSSAEPLQGLIERLAPTGDALLVLDGCEQVIDAVVDAVVTLLQAAPQLRVLVTSRWPLGVAGERSVELEALHVPESDSPGFTRSAAVQLLADRVAGRNMQLRLDERNAEPLRILCERCGGIPLALELAAAQLASMAVGDLLDSLPDAAEGAADVLDALLAQSYAALGSDEAAVFRAWGVVDGSMPLALVRGLVAHSVPSARVARLLAELADAGLVGVDRSGPRWRYHMDDQMRIFARQRAAEHGDAPDALEGLVDALRSVLPPDARTPPAPFADAIADAADGFRSAFAAAVDGRLPRRVGLELAFRLHRYWAASGLAEGRYWLERLLDGAEATDWRPYATFAAGYLAYWAEGGQSALTLLEDAAAGLRGIDDGFAARALVFAGGLADDLDQPDASLADVRTAIDLAQSADDSNLLVSASMGLGSLLAERGDPAAVDRARRALEICAERGSPDQLQATLATAAMIAWQVGDTATAREWVADGSALLGGPPRIARVVLATAAAGCALEADDLERAAELIQEALRDAVELGVDRELPLAQAVAARICVARGDLDGARDLALEQLTAVQRLGFAYPRATALETAAVVSRARGADEDLVVPLLATAAAIRARGSRSAPAPIRVAAPDDAQPSLDPPPDTADAIETARRLLTA
jgi:DNA-binding SARP family transcriptional activator/predicted ATPase